MRFPFGGGRNRPDRGRRAAPSPDDATRLAERGIDLYTRASRTGDREGLAVAIDHFRRAVVGTPVGHPNRAAWLSNLEAALQARFDWTGERADLDEAIRIGREAVAAAPPDHPDPASFLVNLGGGLLHRYRLRGELADLDEAIEIGRRAVALRGGHSNKVNHLANLAVALRLRFERTDARADLDEAIRVGQAAVTAMSPDGPERAASLSGLSRALLTRYERTGARADLDEGVSIGRQAVDATSPGDPGRPLLVSNLANAVHARFARTDAWADLEEATRLSRAALAATPADSPDRAYRLSNLGLILEDRAERTGERADLDEAISVGRQAVAAVPADRPDRARALSNLGLALRLRFEQGGALPDLDEAIGFGRQALAATSADHPDRTAVLSNLAIALRMRFERTGARSDLDEAVGADREALAAALPDGPTRAVILANLAVTFRVRFGRYQEPADLDESITAAREALAATPVDHPGRTAVLSTLGLALRARYELADAAADLDESIVTAREAVTASPGNHPRRAGYLSNLGIALQARFELTNDRSDLDEAVVVSRDAVAANPAGHPTRAGHLVNLGTVALRRFELTGERSDLDEAISSAREATAVAVAPPRLRVIAARLWGAAAAAGQRWSEAVDGFAAATDLLRLLTPRSLNRGDQEHLLDELSGLGADAAACCVRAGLTERAVEPLEQSRGVLLAQALDTRTDLTALAERHPGLARRFATSRDQLDDPGTETNDRPLDVAARERTAAALDTVIEEIRRRPGFASFLRSPSLSDLLAAAADGPVVVIVVSRLGSCALVVTADGVREPLPLPELTPTVVYDQMVAFLLALMDISFPSEDAGPPSAAEGQLNDVLGWLWDTVAGPVLDFLGITGPPVDGEPWPRLWWCPSGYLSLLPVHAAGHHAKIRGAVSHHASPETVIDRVISSQTPTLRALVHARRPLTGSDADGRADGVGAMVAVAMPHTPDVPYGDLPGAAVEVAGLRTRYGSRVLTGADATRDAVLAALRSAGRAHFACHAEADLTRPSESRLLLHDHRERSLTVVDIARLRIDGAELAYLSACSTARGGNRVVDEAIHLTSAFQLAGYRHVIGTLWPVGDGPAVTMADRIYSAIDESGDIAAAVHSAALHARDRWGSPSIWAAYVHSGP